MKNPSIKHLLTPILISVVLASPSSWGQESGPTSSSPYSLWKSGPPSDPNFFPIAVWLQAPKNAARYKAAGIDLYVGLWRGPTSDQLAELEKAGMRVICSQSRAGLENKDNPIIVGWMHGDEPDNAQSLGQGKGYGPPILPETTVRSYERIRQTDPSRPVLLNLGQGVAYDNYIGRGVRRNHPEDYPEYLKGCDIASFDIYPVVHDKPEVSGKLEFVPKGVARLVEWTGGAKPVLKRTKDAAYLFAVAMRNEPVRGTFRVRGLLANADVEVLSESRKIAIQDGGFTDEFKPYEVHLYRISGKG